MSAHYSRTHRFRVTSPRINPQEVTVQDSEEPSIEEISIRFTYQCKFVRKRCAGSHLEEMNLHKRSHPKIPLRYHKLSVGVFREGDDSLFNYLKAWLSRYGLNDNIKPMANAIIRKWIEIKDVVLRTYDRKVFPLFVDLIIINEVVVCEFCTILRQIGASLLDLLDEFSDEEERDYGWSQGTELILIKKVGNEEEEYRIRGLATRIENCRNFLGGDQRRACRSSADVMFAYIFGFSWWSFSILFYEITLLTSLFIFHFWSLISSIFPFHVT